MKVILLQDVAKIGRRGQVSEVPTGYAQNKLIPQGMAKPATPANLKQTAALQAQAKAAQVEAEHGFADMAEQLKDMVVTVAMDANEQGHLFQAVKAEDIVAAAATAGVTVPSHAIVMGQPIKGIGTHEVSLVQGNDAKTTMQLEVVAK